MGHEILDLVEVVNAVDDVDLHRIHPRYCVLDDFFVELFVTLRRYEKFSLNGECPGFSARSVSYSCFLFKESGGAT